MAAAAILDVDGTLVDTNYHHAIAWYRAFRAHEVTPAIWRIHRREAEGELYMELIDEVQVLDGARELIAEIADAVVLASSAKEHEVEHYLDLLDARELATAWTTGWDCQAAERAGIPAP